MPNTRSTVSESGDTVSRAELEILNKRVTEKEKMLKEQAQALQAKQRELTILQQNIESRNADAGNGQIDTILNTLQEQISALSSLPFQMENLNQRVA